MARLLRSRISVLFLLAGVFAVSTILRPTAAFPGQAQQAAAAGPLTGCPGKPIPTQYVGKSETRPIAQAVVNGKPMEGRWFAPGAHTYWHCHPGGQFMVVMEGTGRAQKRGQRMRDLAVGEIEFAAPWVEHWHGAAADSSAQYLQVSFQAPSNQPTLWMEPVNRDDYLGNDIGLGSRVAK